MSPSHDAATGDRCQAEKDTTPVVFFDGVCGLCNRSVDFLLRHDTQKHLLFAPLQGPTAENRLPPQDAANLNSIVFAANGKTWRRTAALVRILWQLGPFWKILGTLLWIIPRPLRDAGYMCISRSRYRLFGKHETCRLPTPEERERFLP